MVFWCGSLSLGHSFSSLKNCSTHVYPLLDSAEETENVQLLSCVWMLTPLVSQPASMPAQSQCGHGFGVSKFI